MTKIKSIVARQIFDSRGNPTVETDVITTNNVIGRAAVPSGASTGVHESVELRDNHPTYMGKSVFNAVKNVNELISKELNNLSIFDQELIDEKMINLDGTNNKSKLGANAILSVSLAVSKAAANEKNISLYKYLGTSVSNVLPVPLMNIINGGSHSDSPISFQEFMIVPIGAKSFTNALQVGNEVFHNLKSILKSRGLSTAVGDEGGFAPELKGTEDAINTIIEAVNKAGYEMKKDVMLALDCASSEFYKDGYYDYSIFEKDNPTNIVGRIRYDNGQTHYNTTSDYRLKENNVAITDGITRISQLKPYRFNFKVDPSKTVDGFFAHEVSSVVPEAISGEKDAVTDILYNAQDVIDGTLPDGKSIGDVKESGVIEPQEIDQAKLVPLLVAAVQELIAEVEKLKSS